MKDYYTQFHGNYRWPYHGPKNAMNRSTYMLFSPLDKWAVRHVKGGSAKVDSFILKILAIIFPFAIIAFGIALGLQHAKVFFI